MGTTYALHMHGVCVMVLESYQKHGRHRWVTSDHVYKCWRWWTNDSRRCHGCVTPIRCMRGVCPTQVPPMCDTSSCDDDEYGDDAHAADGDAAGAGACGDDSDGDAYANEDADDGDGDAEAGCRPGCRW